MVCVKFSEKLRTNAAPFEYRLLDRRKVVQPKPDQLDPCLCILHVKASNQILDGRNGPRQDYIWPTVAECVLEMKLVVLKF